MQGKLRTAEISDRTQSSRTLEATTPPNTRQAPTSPQDAQYLVRLTRKPMELPRCASLKSALSSPVRIPPNPKLSAPRSKDAKVVELAARRAEAVRRSTRVARCGHVKAELEGAIGHRAEATGK